MLTLLIGLAGALGALSRYLLGRFIAERVSAQFPLGTLIINISGAFVIGLLFALAGHKIISPAVQLVLATGYLGGFTTFITMSWVGVQLVRGGNTGVGFLGAYTTFSSLALGDVQLISYSQEIYALLYFLLSLFGGVLAVMLGDWLGQKVVGRFKHARSFRLEKAVAPPASEGHLDVQD